MGTGFQHIRVGHAGAQYHHGKRAPSASCATGGFYKNPSNGASIDSEKPLHVTWDNTCLNSSKVDIYLIAPTMQHAQLHVWKSVDNSPGSFQASLEPKWWNATASESLQLTIIGAGQPPFMSSMPAGPVFTATYTAPANGHVPDNANPNIPDSSFTDVNGAVASSHMSKGKVAAAVLLPLLLVVAAIAIYVRMLRAKGIEKRKRWSEAVDKRMSTISSDWKAMSGASANAAMRSSMSLTGQPARTSLANLPLGGGRMSYGSSRLSSMAVGEYGFGARGLYNQDNTTFDEVPEAPQMAQLRPGITTASLAAERASRVSRVSFADDPRGSMDSRRVVSRAFHHSNLPPLPHMRRQNTIDVDSTQREGPLDLTPEDIRARLSGHSESRKSVDEVFPALSMMRTGGEDNVNDGNNDSYLLWEATSPSTPSESPVPPPPAVSKTNFGMMPSMTMTTATPPNVMSPDEMLRAYAERATTNSPAFPSPVMYNGGSPRTLYSPTPPSPSPSSPSVKLPKMLPSLLRKGSKEKRGKRLSEKWSEEDAYSGSH